MVRHSHITRLQHVLLQALRQGLLAARGRQPPCPALDSQVLNQKQGCQAVHFHIPLNELSKRAVRHRTGKLRGTALELTLSRMGLNKSLISCSLTMLTYAVGPLNKQAAEPAGRGKKQGPTQL